MWAAAVHTACAPKSDSPPGVPEAVWTINYCMWLPVRRTGLFTQEFRDMELNNNRKHFNRYGLPLDNRSDYTKSDWWVWVASMASKKSDFISFVRPLWQAFNDSASRVPMTDWFDTVTAREVTFQHRSVQGGLFMKMLLDSGKCFWKK